MTTMFTADTTFESAWGADSAGRATGGALRLLDHGTVEGRAAWEAVWRRAGQGEVFAHPDYCADRALPGERALCAAMEFPDGALIIYPFLVRAITHDAAGAPVAEGLWDIYTPMVYGGPLGHDASGAQVEEFWCAMRAWARHHSVVSEIIRFTPIARHRLPYPGTLRRQAPHVVIDLEGGEEGILARMRKSARRLYRRALDAGVTVRIENSEAGIEDFLAIHDETMTRAGAYERFRLRPEDLRALHRAVPEHLFYVFACQDGRPVAVEVVLRRGDSSHAYLGGTLTAALRTGATTVVSIAAAVEAQRRGSREHVLGGGVTNTIDDSLLEFKRSLAREGDRDYFTGEQVFLEDEYERLCAPVPSQGSSFFPLYRARAAVTRHLPGQEPGRPDAPARGTDQR
jgi:hypothetical protein